MVSHFKDVASFVWITKRNWKKWLRFYCAFSVQTSKGFWFLLFRQSSDSGFKYANHNTTRLARRERKSFNRKSKEIEELRLIYYVERGAMSKPANGKGNFDSSVIKFRVSSTQRKAWQTQWRFLRDFRAHQKFIFLQSNSDYDPKTYLCRILLLVSKSAKGFIEVLSNCGSTI